MSCAVTTSVRRGLAARDHRARPRRSVAAPAWTVACACRVGRSPLSLGVRGDRFVERPAGKHAGQQPPPSREERSRRAPGDGRRTRLARTTSTSPRKPWKVPAHGARQARGERSRAARTLARAAKREPKRPTSIETPSPTRPACPADVAAASLPSGGSFGKRTCTMTRPSSASRSEHARASVRRGRRRGRAAGLLSGHERRARWKARSCPDLRRARPRSVRRARDR